MDCCDCGTEARDAKRWLFFTLIISVAFAFFLFKTDRALTTSNSEEIKARELNRLRVAQSTLPVGDIDDRQVVRGGEARSE